MPDRCRPRRAFWSMMTFVSSVWCPSFCSSRGSRTACLGADSAQARLSHWGIRQTENGDDHTCWIWNIHNKCICISYCTSTSLNQQLLAGFTGRFVSWCHCKLCTMFKMFYTAPSGVLLLIAYSDSFHLLLLLTVRLSAQPFIWYKIWTDMSAQ